MSPKGRDILKSMVGAVEPTRPEVPSVQQPHRPSGAVKAMNLSLGRLGEEAAAAKALRESLASGDKVLEIDPAAIEMSFIRDRIPVDKDAEFERLKQSIQESGQQVPILVRPDPVRAGHYQAAYGHRRLRAAAEIGVPVKAVVRKLTDEELILAQGQENGPRVDLSFIERALFARRMDEHGFSRDMIAKALATDKPETSRLLQVAQTIDPEIILAIGPAPRSDARAGWLLPRSSERRADRRRRGPQSVTLVSRCWRPAAASTSSGRHWRRRAHCNGPSRRSGPKGARHLLWWPAPAKPFASPSNRRRFRNSWLSGW